MNNKKKDKVLGIISASLVYPHIFHDAKQKINAE